ncbi:hypothetical protein [Streptomyces sp. NPDC048425]
MPSELTGCRPNRVDRLVSGQGEPGMNAEDREDRDDGDSDGGDD